jgi:single-strand DNA-binding protein
MQSIEYEPTNHVVLCGRLGNGTVERTLPSGDRLTNFRLTVDRPASDAGRVDSIDCATDKARVRRTLERASPGDVLHVEGTLRRRFWRGPSGISSRYEVRVSAARIVLSAGRRSA